MVNDAADLVVRHGVVVTHDQQFRADIAVTDGKVSAIGTTLPAGRHEFDATGLHVLPGLVDAHVHLRDPGPGDEGDFRDGTRAAAAGGVTTVLDMPTTDPPVGTAEIFEFKRQRVEPKAHVDFGLYGLFATDNADDFASLAAAGCMGLKLYMARSVADVGVPDDGAILTGLRAARDSGLVVGVHAENDRLVRLFSDQVRQQGRTDPASHSAARPELAETEAVTRIVSFAAAVGASLHLHHVSTGAALERVRQLRRDGCAVTVEVVIAHLMLDQDNYPRYGNLIKLNPPVRTARDVQALWQGITRGDVDLVATDHAPHTDAAQDDPDVWRAQGGFIGVQTLLPVMLAQVAAGTIVLSDVVRLCAYHPARRWNIPGKGTLVPGADADLVVLDMTRTATIEPEQLHTAATRTPFAGLPTTGVIRRTYLRGALIAVDGRPVGRPTGRLVRPDRTTAPGRGVTA